MYICTLKGIESDLVVRSSIAVLYFNISSKGGKVKGKFQVKYGITSSGRDTL